MGAPLEQPQNDQNMAEPAGARGGEENPPVCGRAQIIIPESWNMGIRMWFARFASAALSKYGHRERTKRIASTRSTCGGEGEGGCCVDGLQGQSEGLARERRGLLSAPPQRTAIPPHTGTTKKSALSGSACGAQGQKARSRCASGTPTRAALCNAASLRPSSPSGGGSGRSAPAN